MPNRASNPIHDINPLETAARYLQSLGNRGDSLLVHINPREAEFLKARGGSGTVNPKTGLLQFDDGDGGNDSGNDGNAGGGGAVGGGSATGGLGGGYGGFGEGVGQSRDAPADNGGGGRGGFGGETGTGHALGESGWGSGMVGGFGQPSTGSGFFDSGINSAVNNPIGTALAFGLNMAVPGLGLASTVSKAFGGPSTQGLFDAMAAHGTPSGSLLGGQQQGGEFGAPAAPTGVPGGGGVSPAALGAQAARAVAPQAPFTQNFQGYPQYDPRALMALWAQRQRGLLG